MNIFAGFNMSEFLAMGGYAVYVWPTYVLAGIVLGGLIVQSLWMAGAASRRLAAESSQANLADDAPARPDNAPAP